MPKGHPIDIEGRFWRRVQKTDGCWLWTGRKEGKTHKYGTIKIKGRTIRVTRFVWMIAYGDDAAGLHVLHRCDTPACVNPEHLFLGTHQDNMDDRTTKGRNNAPVGSNHWKARLTEEQVIAIRAERAAGAKSAVLASKYGVPKTTVDNVVRKGKIWRHI